MGIDDQKPGKYLDTNNSVKMVPLDQPAWFDTAVEALMMREPPAIGAQVSWLNRNQSQFQSQESIMRVLHI